MTEYKYRIVLQPEELKRRSAQLREALDRNDRVLWESRQTETDHKESVSHQEMKESETPSNHEKLRILATLIRVADNVDHPIWAVPFEEICHLLLDLGLLFQNSDQQLTLNSEVFEDPAQRSDVLGNVKMLHIKQTRPETEALKLLGTSLLDLVHWYKETSKEEDRESKIWSVLDMDQDSYAFNDLQINDFLAAKQEISRLRKLNFKLDRRNEKLWQRLKTPLKRQFMESLSEKERQTFRNDLEMKKSFTYPHKIKNSAGEFVDAPDFSTKQSLVSDVKIALPTVICTDCDDEMLQHQSRKLAFRQKSTSQKDGFTW